MMGKRNRGAGGPGLRSQVSWAAILVGSALGGSASAVAQTVASAQPGAAPASTNSTADIVVTATRRSESIHNVPSSISALSQAALEESGATQASDIIHMVPGLAYTQNSVGQAIFAVRGIQTSAITGNVQAPVAVYFNEVPVLDPFIPWTVPSLALFDVSRVEVLRGPQGTLFGAGALSGAIRIITNKPDASKISVATDDTVSTTKGGGVSYLLNGMVNIPIVRDQLAVRAVGYYDYTAGWIEGYRYTQTNYALLGKIISRLSGKPFAEFIAERQFAVAGMPNTGYFTDQDIVPNRANTYMSISAEGEPAGKIFNSHLNWPPILRTAAGLQSTAGDLANWIIALQSGKLLEQASSIETMLTPVSLHDGQPGVWGIGWIIGSSASGHFPAPGGGAKAQVVLYPGGTAIVLLTNLIGAFPEHLAVPAASRPDLAFIDPIAELYCSR